MSTPPTILCLASYEKGADFMREAKRQGSHVILLAVQSLEHIPWPRESIDELYFMPDLDDVPAVINGVSYLARTRAIDRIVPLDEYDVLLAATLREHLRLQGMSESATRYLRDKLAMRVGAREHDIPVPEFVSALNDDAVRAFLERVPPPWLIKPRAEASTIGIARMERAEEVWPQLEALGDRRSFHLIERFIPGEVFHADSIIWNGEVVFATVGQYGKPPLEVFHGGGSARTRMIRRRSPDEQAVQALNKRVLDALGPDRGATHMEFIKSQDSGRFYFLEVAARVGGAYIADVVEAATGINLWAEWAKVECAHEVGSYAVPTHREEYAGVIITLARQETPDTAAYIDPEIAWRMQKANHVGFIVASPTPERVEFLLEDYNQRFATDFTATLPPWTSRPPSTS